MSTATLKTETIDGVTYQVSMLPARRATHLLVRLAQMLGPAFGAAVGEGGSLRNVLDAKIDFGRAVGALLAHTDEAGIDAVLMTLAEVTLADGQALKPIYDLHFQGAQGRLWKWVAFGLRSQYADFLGELSSVAELLDLLKKGPDRAEA